MILHRGTSRVRALLLSFVWLYASTLAILFIVGPLMLGFLQFVGDVEASDDVVDVVRSVGDVYVAILTLEWVSGLQEDESWWMLGILGGWVLLQVLFLSPLVGPPRVDGEGRPMLPSLIAAVLIATTGTALAWVAIVEAVFSLFVPDARTFDDAYQRVVVIGWIPALAVWTVGGWLWFRALRSAGSSHDPAGLDRHLRRVLAGTAVEAALGTIALLMVRRRTDCLCATGSFLSLGYSLMVLVWLCGPWAVLFFTREERSKWSRRACGGCGYVRRSDASRCSECGREFPGPVSG